MAETEHTNWIFFREQLLDWYRPDRRPMPWKGLKDPYFIWLSEIILQQTRVEQGWKYFEKFRDHYPDIHALANADDEAVMKDWEGLGYYSRARNLLKAARLVSKEMGGAFPSHYTGLLTLPGVGPYTAAAIASFAYDEAVAVLDGNVYRILSRFTGESTPIDNGLGKKIFGKMAQEALALDQPAIYNQAIMDFGALVCKPKRPLCISCPLANNCIALSGGIVTELPIKEKKLKKRTRYFHYFLITDTEGNYLVEQRKGKDIWQDLYQFPLVEVKDENYSLDNILSNGDLPQELKALDLRGSRSYPPRKQQLTHQTIVGYFHVFEVAMLSIKRGNYSIVSPKEGTQKAYPKMLASFIAEKDVILDLFLSKDK